MAKRTAQSIGERAHAANARAELAEAQNRERAARLRARLYKAQSGVLKMASGDPDAPTYYGGRTRGYTNVRSSRLRYGAMPRGGSADHHLAPLDLALLRHHSQALMRNNLPARMIIGRLVDLVAAGGFTAKPTTDDDSWNAMVAEKFLYWGTDLSGAGADARGLMTYVDMQCSSLYHMAVDGDVGWIKLKTGSLQGIEGERIQTPGTLGTGVITPTMVAGVELNGVGRPVFYHIAEWSNDGSFTTGRTSPVAAENFLHLRNPIGMRIGQTRGEPALAASISALDDLDAYMEAVEVAARVAAAQALIITKDNPALDQNLVVHQDMTRSDGIAGSDREEEVQPGRILRLKPGEKVEAFKPEQPTTNLDAYVRTKMLPIAADVGVPLLIALLSVDGANYSALRSLMALGFRRMIRWQDGLVNMFLARSYWWRLAMWIQDGEVPARDDWMKHRWVAPPVPVLDPKVEAEAAAFRINNLLGSREHVLEETYGIKLIEMYNERVKEINFERANGIEPRALPGQVAGQSKDNAQAGAQDQNGV